ncbi:hypothetical protein AAFF_G00222710 [Aldrovandia affinis]|uniref:Uncharacterized protein n=1 Tax=Aldrovandia affinis TaxID=143900 RepID=A0AAD7RFB7_9TELE|nr:hypothetical protein AAFF_G00222710 [Aldrovandia affinis]
MILFCSDVPVTPRTQAAGKPIKATCAPVCARRRLSPPPRTHARGISGISHAACRVSSNKLSGRPGYRFTPRARASPDRPGGDESERARERERETRGVTSPFSLAAAPTGDHPGFQSASSRPTGVKVSIWSG